MAGDAFMAMELSGARDFDGTLAVTLGDIYLWNQGCDTFLFCPWVELFRARKIGTICPTKLLALT